MRSQHRAPLVAYAIVAIVGLFVIMQTLSPDVMALQRVPRTLTGHGAYRIEDPAPPLSPQPSTAGASAPARTPEAGPSPTSSAGDPSAMPGTSTVPAAHGKRRHSSAPGTPSAGSSGHTAAPPVQTPPATIYLLPPVGNLPGVPLPVQPEPPLSQVLDSLAPTGDGQSGDGASGNGAGQGQDKGQEQPPGKAVKTLTKAAKSAGKAVDKAGQGDQSDPADGTKQPADAVTPSPPTVMLAGPLRTLAAAVPSSEPSDSSTPGDCAPAPKSDDEVASLGAVLADAGIDPAQPAPSADGEQTTTCCDDSDASGQGDAQPSECATPTEQPSTSEQQPR